MKKLLADVVMESTATVGAGSATLAQITGWARFSDRFANGDLVHYSIRDGNNWEIGIGTYTTANILARTTILGTLVAGVWTSAGAAMALSGSSALVRATATESLLTDLWKVSPVTVAGNTSCVAGASYMVTVNAATLTLPTAPLIGDRIDFMQAAAGVTGTIVDPGANNINGNAGTMSVDLADFSFALVWFGGAYGWKVRA